MTDTNADDVFWRDDIDSLAFRPQGHGGLCVMHRRAFRALLGVDATAPQCFEYFAKTRATFEQAAAQKIRRAKLAAHANFHINSRDVRRTVTRGAKDQLMHLSRMPSFKLFDAPR